MNSPYDPPHHEIRLARADKTRPVVVLTRGPAIPALRKVTVAPITSTVRGLVSEVPLGRENGLEQECAASLDNVETIDQKSLGRHIGYLSPAQERRLAIAVALAYDLDISLVR